VRAVRGVCEVREVCEVRARPLGPGGTQARVRGDIEVQARVQGAVAIGADEIAAAPLAAGECESCRQSGQPGLALGSEWFRRGRRPPAQGQAGEAAGTRWRG